MIGHKKRLFIYICVFFCQNSVLVKLEICRNGWVDKWQQSSPSQKRKAECRKAEVPEKEGEVKEETEEGAGAEAEENESSRDSSDPAPAKEEQEVRPAKKPRINPYGVWEQIQEEEDP